MAVPDAPLTSTFVGPGTYCGAFLVSLKDGDHVTTWVQMDLGQTTFTIAGREVSIAGGPDNGSGQNSPVVLRFSGGSIRQFEVNGYIQYRYSLDDGFPAFLTSSDFQGFAKDSWFFDRVNFDPAVQHSVQCLKPVNNVMKGVD